MPIASAGPAIFSVRQPMRPAQSNGASVAGSPVSGNGKQ
jgi:hypothetical protein